MTCKHCKDKQSISLLPEIKMCYNVQDNKYYIYFGEDFLDDTNDKYIAFSIFEEHCRILKEGEGCEN